jgi:hypothetical protein
LDATRPGSNHDSRVFRLSTLFARMDNGWRPIPDGVLLADLGFPCNDFCLTAIRGNNLTDGQRRFNLALKNTRFLIENTFGVIKKRFHILNSLPFSSALKCSQVINTCFIMHNLCVRDLPDNIVPPPPNLDLDDHDDNAVQENENFARRNQIVQYFERN